MAIIWKKTPLWWSLKGQLSRQILKRKAFMVKAEGMIFVAKSDMIALVTNYEWIAMWGIIRRFTVAYHKEMFFMAGSVLN